MARLPLFGLAALAFSIPAQDKGFAGELPVLPGLTDAPPSGHTFVLEVRRDGTAIQDGKLIDFATLRTRLARFAARHPDKSLTLGKRTLSLGQLHLRLHPELPVDALYRLLELCAEPGVMVHRVFLAARGAKGGAECSFPVFLPIDRGGAAQSQSVVPVEIRYTRPPGDPAALRKRFAAVEQQPVAGGGKRKPTALLMAASHTPLASVLTVAHIARQAGFEDFGFGRLDKPDYPAWDKGSKDLRKLVAARRPRPGSEPGVVIGAASRWADLEEEEEVEEEIVEEAVVDEQDVQAKQANKQAEEIEEVGPEPKKLPAALRNRKRPPTGPDVQAKVSVNLALLWLARHQDTDGRWDADDFMKHDPSGRQTDGKGGPVYDVGVTGLALLAFLGDGHTLRSGPHQDVVKKAVRWLRSQQDDKGLFGTRASHDFIYGHAIATLAMCEAFGMSGYDTLKDSAQRGLDYLERHRNPYGVWRYQARDNDNDSSVTSWCLMAYKAGKDFGLRVNGQAFQIAEGFLEALTDPANGRLGYTKRGEGSSRKVGNHARLFPNKLGDALTAAGLFSRFMLGQDPGDRAVMHVAADTMLETLPKWQDDGRIDLYYWYYGTHAMYQMGGAHWDRWRKAVYQALVSNQRKDKSFTGSWDAVSVWSVDGGRIYATAMATLALESSYRYARLVKR